MYLARRSPRKKNATADRRREPVAVPVSPCASGGGSSVATSDAAASVAHNRSCRDIQSKYRIDPKVLAAGSFGSVRACVDRTSGRRCAVKSVRKRDPAAWPGSVAREVVLLGEMAHPRIVGLVDACEDSEHAHVVTELCAGGELFHEIKRRSSDDGADGAACFGEKEAARIVHEILAAVSYMHRRGIVHRDIKPENILFETTEDDSPIKIVDFGLARTHAEGVEPPMTAVVGTPYYTAPEVLRKEYSKSCDLWSVGIVSYILLCGYPPFNGADDDETHRSVLRGRYGFPSKEWKGVSREAVDFVRRLLQVDPSKRMTAEEALNHPWIVMHAHNDARKGGVASGEGIGKGSRLSRGSIFRDGLAGQKIRVTMFDAVQDF